MKQCEICGSELRGKQQRFCCKRCRNIAGGRVGTKRYPVPARDELAKLYLLPPEGQGLSAETISLRYGVSDVTVLTWIKDYGFLQEPRLRLSYFQKKNAKLRIPIPEKSELEALYKMPPDGKGMSQEQVAERYGIERQTARRWLGRYGLLETHHQRHSKRMSATGNPAYKKGNSQRFVAKQLAASKPRICEWCGHNQKVQLHHIDHNRMNNGLENLMWLCHNCNILEAHLWALRESGRADILFSERQITVKFRTHNQEE